MISAKKHFMNQWQVVNCRVNVGNVIGYFAKSQTASWKAIGRFEEKSEGGNFTTQSPGLLPQQDIIQIFSAVPRLMTGIRNNLGRLLVKTADNFDHSKICQFTVTVLVSGGTTQK